MVEIECPHCDEDIELDDDEFGLFECPDCEEEFLWEQESKSIEIKPAADFSVSDIRYFLPPAVLIGGFIIIGLILLSNRSLFFGERITFCKSADHWDLWLRS